MKYIYLVDIADTHPFYKGHVVLQRAFTELNLAEQYVEQYNETSKTYLKAKDPKRVSLYSTLTTD